MKRSLTLLVFGVLGGLPTMAYAAPDPTDPYSAEALRRAEIDAYRQAAASETNPQTKAAYLAKARQLAEAADADAARRSGASRQVDEITRRMEREDRLAEARAKQMEDMYDRPGFFDKVGNKMVDVLGNAIAAMLQKWIAGGGKDKDLENEIRRLQDERDRLMNGRDDPGLGSDTGTPGMGRIITDANGNYGYDRDGDGIVDIPLNDDGSLGSFNPSNDDGYASPGSTNGLGGGGGTNPFDSPTSAGAAGAIPGLGSVGGGGVSPGGSFNGGGFTPNNGGANPGGSANADGKDDKDEDGEDGGPLGGAGGGAAGGVNGASANLGGSKDINGDGKIDENEAALETVMGRPLILPKLEFEDLAGDKKAASKGWKDEWEDDGWDDERDNGDKKKKKKSGDNKDGSDDWSDDDDWGDEWDESKKAGKKKTDAKSDTTSAEEKEAAELVDQIIRVETQLAEWRKQEKKAKAEGKDVYGYTEAGAEKKDPLKDVRDSSGKIDLTKVDIWLIERETWRDGKEPVRYKLKVNEDVKDLDPIHGGVIVVRGKIEALNVDKRVLDEIKGKVKEIEVAQVILSAEKPPENLDSSLDESDDVGGLDEDDGHGHDKDKKGDDWGSDDEGW